MQVYVAGKSEDAKLVSELADMMVRVDEEREILEEPLEISSTWHDRMVFDKKTKACEEWSNKDLDEILNSDALVILSSSYEDTTHGRAVEYGYALGNLCPIVLVGEHSGMFFEYPPTSHSTIKVVKAPYLKEWWEKHPKRMLPDDLMHQLALDIVQALKAVE